MKTETWEDRFTQIMKERHGITVETRETRETRDLHVPKVKVQPEIVYLTVSEFEGHLNQPYDKYYQYSDSFTIFSENQAIKNRVLNAYKRLSEKDQLLMKERLNKYL